MIRPNVGLCGLMLLILGSGLTAAPPRTRPHGLVAVKEYRERRVRGFHAGTMEDPDLCGVCLRMDWREVEPSEGQFQWRALDALMTGAATHGKWVHLMIIPGFGTPSWALAGVETAHFARKYGRHAGATGPLPMPWDPLYQRRWFDFLKALQARYGANPALLMVAAAGPTSVSAEMSLPNTQEDIALWRRHHYSPRRYIDAWDGVFARYAGIFAAQYISLSLYPGLPLDAQGVDAPDERDRTRQAVIDAGIRRCGSRFALQSSGLHAGKDALRADSGAGYTIVRGYCPRIVTGFQASTSATRRPGKMGDPTSVATALRRTIEKGLEPGPGGAHVDYLEIYEPDVLNPQARPALDYGRRCFAATSRP